MQGRISGKFCQVKPLRCESKLATKKELTPREAVNIRIFYFSLRKVLTIYCHSLLKHDFRYMTPQSALTSQFVPSRYIIPLPTLTHNGRP